MKILLRKAMEFVASKALVSKKFKRRSGEVVILMYHGVVDSTPALADWCLITKEKFEEQIKFLKENFNVISLSEAVDGLKNGTIDGPTAVITFDDGYQNNYDVALPILEAYNVPATIYITTKFIGTDDTLWTGRLQNAFSKTTLTNISWRGEFLDLSSIEHKKCSMELIKSTLKQEHFSVIEKETNKVVDKLSEGKGFLLDVSSPYRMLSFAMVNHMAQSGLIEFGAHAHNHPILSGLSKQEQENEIKISIELASKFSGVQCGAFAYPNGRPVDFTHETVKILEEQKMYCSVSTILGVCKSDTPLMSYRRFGVGCDTDFKRGLYDMYTKHSN